MYDRTFAADVALSSALVAAAANLEAKGDPASLEEARDLYRRAWEAGEPLAGPAYARCVDRISMLSGLPGPYGTFRSEVDGIVLMPWTDPAITDEERRALGLPNRGILRQEIVEENRQRGARLGEKTGLPQGVEWLPVWRPWTTAELLARNEAEGRPVWRDGEDLVFTYRGEADAVELMGGLHTFMWRVHGSNLWAVGTRSRALDEATISYCFRLDRSGESVFSLDRSNVWCGPLAPKPPRRAQQLEGAVLRENFPSHELEQERFVTVYIPPRWSRRDESWLAFATDGFVPADVVEPLILDGGLPPIILVGVASATDSVQRGAEYLGLGRPIFESHMRFFTDEVFTWLGKTLDLALPPARCIVSGFSNGGAFAIWAGIRRPDRFGHVLAFSVAGSDPPLILEWGAGSRPTFQLTAGTLEVFRSNTLGWARRLTDAGVICRHEELVFGHDPLLWELAFVNGLQRLATRLDGRAP